MAKRQTRRGSAPRGLPARGFPEGPILGLGAVFVASLIIGIVFGGVWSRFEQKGIGVDDYVVMVSLLYARDSNLPAALESLSLLNGDDPGKLVGLAAERYPRSHPDSQSEAQALTTLATKIKEQGTLARASATYGDSESRGDGSPWTWLGVALIAICVLGIGWPLSLRLVKATRRGLSGARIEGKNTARASKWKDVPPRRGTPTARAASAPREEIQEVAQLGREHRPNVAQRTGSLTTLLHGVAPEKRPVTGHPAAHESGPREVFASRYRHGIEPFDEVYTITSPISNELIGACGMSSLLKVANSPDAPYYAMTVWAQDYISKEPLRCIALVSKYYWEHPTRELTRWIRSRVADDVVVPTPELSLTLDTTNLKVEVNVLKTRYRDDAHAPHESCFSELEAHFHVRQRARLFYNGIVD